MLDVRSVIDNEKGAGGFSVAMKWKREGIEGITGEVKKLTRTDIERGSAIGGFGPRVKFVWKAGSDG